jgi:sugar lactone lactonase YvrE
MGVALDAAGNLYVADFGLGKIVIFDPNGYTTHVPATIGTSGTSDGEFEVPVGVAVDSAGNVYVSDLALFAPRTNMIQKFDSKGNFVKGWGTAGTADGQFTYPMGIAVDKYDNVYACDFANRRVQKFDSNGTFLGKWGGVGVGKGTFGWPFDVAINSTGNVLVSDATNNIVQLFAPAP